jgi:hypothetical protein
MMDMSAVIVPKSDQINADDLQGRTRTITVSEVKIKGGQEQPISIHFEGSDKVYRPCKSMCRVMAQAWGLDSSKYVGRSMTLYCDPSVKFGPLAVGGIRISHMSDIDGPMTMALTATKGVKKAFKVLPLEQPQRQVRGSSDFTLDDAKDAIQAAETLADLQTAWRQRVMAPFRDILTDDLQARKDELSSNGPDDTQRGEANATSPEYDLAIDHINRAVTHMAINGLVQDYLPRVREDEQEALKDAGSARRASLNGAA